MAAPWQLVHLPLGGGVNESSDVRVLEPPDVMDADELANIQWDKDGRWSKRFGYTALTGSTGTPHTVFPHGKRRVAINTLGVTEQYNPDDDVWSAWVPPSDTGAEQPRVVPIEISAETVAENQGVLMCDVASDYGTICYAWINDAGFLYARIVDAETGAVELGTRELVDSTKTWSRCRVVLGSTNYCVIAQDDAGNGLYMWYISMSSTPTSWTAVGQITTDQGPFDACDDGGFGGIAIAVYNGTTVVNVYEVTQTGSMSSARALTGEVDVFCIANRATGSDWVVVTAPAAGDPTHTVVNKTALTIQAGPTTIAPLFGARVNQASVIENSGNWWVVWEEQESAGNFRHILQAREFSESGGSISTAGNPLIAYNVKMTAKGFLQDAEPIVPCQFDPGSSVTIPQPCGFLLRARNEGGGTWFRQFSACARFLVDRVERKGTDTTSLSNTVTMSGFGSRYMWCAGAFGANLDKTGIVRVLADTAPPPLPHLEYEGTAYIGAGLLFSYDGELPSETSPLWAPTDVTATAAATGGGVGAGTYQYKAVWEWEDANGILHRSAPSPAASVTTVALDTVTIKCESIEEVSGYVHVRTATRATTDVMPKLAVYRTQVDGTVFNLLTREVPALDAEVGTVSITDTSTDAAIAGNELLYTEGGVLAAEVPPPFLHAVVANGRVWAIHAEKRDEIWPSKLLQSTIAPEWNAALAIKMPEKCTAIAELSGRVIAFSEDAAYQIAGDGPLNTGVGGSFAGPFRLPSATGCLDRQSVAEFPGGLFVRGRRGFEIIGHGGQAELIGRAVSRELGELLDTNVDILRAVHVSKREEIRVLMGVGHLFRWNYRYNRWCKDAFGGVTCDAMVLDGVYEYHTSSQVKVEDDSTRDDDGAHVAFTVATPWIALGGPHGDSRIRRVFLGGENLEDHALTVKIRYDYVDSDVDTLSFTYPEIGAVDPPYDIELRPSRRKCRAIKLIITDATGATAADGPAFSSMAIEAAFTGKGRRITTSARK